MNDQHQGAAAPSLFAHHPDPRVGELDSALRSAEAVIGAIVPGLGLAKDAFRAVINQNSKLPSGIITGTIVHSIAGLGWYKVQIANHGVIACMALTQGSTLPLGARDLGGYQPNTDVEVWKPPGLNYGMILGARPPMLMQKGITNPGRLFQGGQSGYKREKVHKYPIQNAYLSGGIYDWSGQRPVDGTAMERGFISSTGIMSVIDDDSAVFAAHEMCGLFLSMIDGWCRLAGMQMDIESAVHILQARDDEGESRFFKGIAQYPWEAIGLYAKGTKFTAEFSDDEVDLTKPKAKIDLPDGEEDIQPIYRWQEYGGYLGQGYQRYLMKPAKDSGKRKYKDEDVDEGLFAEQVNADGSYFLRSAKSVFIGKRCLIVVPKELKRPEDGTGDDAKKDNYKFSNEFGGGDSHKLKEIKLTGEHKNVRRVAAVEDFIAYNVNWKAVNAFHYHKLDYRTAQESEQTNFTRVQEQIDFGALANSSFLDDPTPKKLKINKNYDSVEYFERESFLYFLDDGGVVLAGGGGEALIFAGGNIRPECPGDIIIAPGKSAIIMGKQVILRAEESVDFSASKGDIRGKAEGNYQMIAGNGGSGGMLLECRTPGRTQRYDNLIGEDVKATGITFKAVQGGVNILGKELYFRTGGGDLGEGDMVFDANRGERKMIFNAQQFDFFCPKEVNFYYGPVGDTSTVNKTYNFGINKCVMDVQLLVGGKVISYTGGGGTGGMIADGGISAVGSIACAGSMADKKGMFLGKIPDGFGDALSSTLSSIADAVQKFDDGGTKKHEGFLVQRYYQKSQPGHDETIEKIAFSYRDDKSERQYGARDLLWPERRWEQMARLGGGSGGTQWEERPVIYQGQELYPWPGRKKWKEEPIFLQLKKLNMFDASAGRSMDRPGPYEEPEIADFDKKTMESGMKVIR